MTHYELWIDGDCVCYCYSLVTMVIYADNYEIDIESDKVQIVKVEGEI